MKCCNANSTGYVTAIISDIKLGWIKWWNVPQVSNNDKTPKYAGTVMKTEFNLKISLPPPSKWNL